jgi:acyl-CoA dehydrogenase
MNVLASIHGALAGLPTGLVYATAVVAACALGFVGAPLLAWTLATGAFLFLVGAPWWVWLLLFVPLVLFNIRPLRASLVSAPVLRTMKRLEFLPAISDTERTAIEAGSVWVDGELFSGRPDFDRLAREPYPALSAREQAFLDGPAETVCRMTDDWEVFRQRDLPQEVWEFLKKERFFGMIIPEKYGGLGFSASGNSAIVTKLASRSGPLGITVMVPNSLGPAELLIHYGTEAQRQRWLPRLARGEEMPCFALTEPGAGSDAGSIAADGVVFRGDDGELWLRLNWNKRYITLAAISTVLGLAFKLRDPDNLLGKGEDLGITCALIPSDTPGVELTERHDPLGVPFYNCPTRGHDVVVPIDCIIGGPDGAGRGWQMLMECLAAGRGISLPATSVATVCGAARVVGAYASVRQQFGLPIGKFEGIEEPLARIGGSAWLLEAARRYTCGGLDSGAKPAVVTAIMKLWSTELARRGINDAMDVLGGAGISLGPRNRIGHAYIAMPISITVEGANILTRTLMIFGQGAIRCHPFAFREIEAVAKNDLREFDRAFWGHVGHVVRNTFRAVLLSVSRGWLARAPVGGPTRVYYKKLAWSSASFALLADLAMALLGGDLKRRERITGRFADVFSWMYLGNAALRRFLADGQQREDLPFLHYTMHEALARMQTGFEEILRHMPVRVPGLGLLFRGPWYLWARLNPLSTGPSDRVASAVARAVCTPGDQRDALTRPVFRPAGDALERAFLLAVEADEVTRKIKAAIKDGRLPRERPATLAPRAVELGVITRDEADLVARAEAARDEAVQVDSFALEEYLETAARPALERV